MRTNQIIFLQLLFLVFSFSSYAQDDLMKVLDEQTKTEKPKTEYTKATFKATRIVNSGSVELPGKGVLQFIIQHRFGQITSGWRELFGIDDADMRLGLDYGVTDWLSLGIGRSSVGGTYDLFGRVKFLRQTEAGRKIPLSAMWYSNIGITSKTQPEGAEKIHRLSYAHQLIVARKFTRNFSLQVMPTYVHLNLDQTAQNENVFNPVTGREDSVVNIYRNNIYSVGIGARYLVSRSVGLNLEFSQPVHIGMAGEDKIPVGSLSFGIDIETGGHVFQITFTNSRGLIEQIYLPDNEGYWWDKNFHIGFNINRAITIVNYEKRRLKKLKKVKNS